MIKLSKIFIYTLFLTYGFFVSSTEPTPPVAKKIPYDVTLHHDTRIDDYHWLRDRNNPEVVNYLLEWNSYTEHAMSKAEQLQSLLYQEMRSRIEEETSSIPLLIGNYNYFTRQTKDQDCPNLFRVKRGEYSEELLIDQNQLAKEYAYFKIQNWSPSPNGEYLAAGIDLEGTEYCTTFLLNCRTKKFVTKEALPSTNKTIIWRDDSQGFWYVKTDDAFRSNKILFHEIGTNPQRDRLIYEETDPHFDLYLYESMDKRFIFINSRSYTASEAFYFARSDYKCQLIPIAKKVPDRQYFPESHDDLFFIRVKNGPHNNSIVIAPIKNPPAKNWKTYTPASKTTQILNHHIFNNYFVLTKMEKGVVTIEVENFHTGDKSTVPFPDPLYSATVMENQDYNSNLLKVEYSSPITPESVFVYNMDTKRLTLQKQRAVQEFDASKYTLERIEAIASDGTSIPISLFYRKDLKGSFPAPMYLYGYGAYEIVAENAFYDPELSLVDRGVICAIAHIRGGGECGRFWYEQGRVLNKTNTFNDFICCAEHLIAKGYTSSSQLAIEGRSAGGTLIGAVINMRPELFKAAIAGVPFVDVMTTMSDLTIPYSTQDQEEWGDCSKKEVYDYMKSYSPYDNVERKDYPSLLITAGFHDAQVPFWEAAKWTAKLLEHKTDSNPLLFHTNMSAGHYSFSKRSLYLKDIAFKYTFVLDQISCPCP